MKTAHKIALAKLAYTVVHSLRAAVGLNDQCIVRRNGVVYELNLAEGIDFAVFLPSGFEPATAAALARFTRPGMTVIDVGANFGIHTMRLGHLVGPTGSVFAFEPT